MNWIAILPDGIISAGRGQIVVEMRPGDVVTLKIILNWIDALPDGIIATGRGQKVVEMRPGDVVNGASVKAAQRADALPRRVVVLRCDALGITWKLIQ